MNDIRTCKGCAKPVGDTSSRPVGEWRFCHECFDKLFAPQQDSVDLTRDSASEAVTESQETVTEHGIDLSTMAFESEMPAQKVCRICEAPSASGEYIQVAGLLVCSACYAKMMPVSKPKPKAVEPEEVKLEPIVIEPVGVRNLKCTACQRPITARGAKKRDEALYCPDCFVKLPAPA